jgi:3D (Asp-Asp-Asp) domain-containing protein
MKSLFGGSAALVASLLATTAIFYAQPTLAETISLQQDSTQQEKKQETKTQDTTAQTEQAAEGEKAITTDTKTTAETAAPETIAAPAEHYTATAYAFRGRTASGRAVGKGVIAADTRVLPFGTRVRLEAGNWSGVYTVADTGGAIRGRKIDVWVPTTNEACRFGRRKVKLTVLSYGGRRNRAQAK